VTFLARAAHSTRGTRRTRTARPLRVRPGLHVGRYLRRHVRQVIRLEVLPLYREISLSDWARRSW
jgi:hypothetical protein